MPTPQSPGTNEFRCEACGRHFNTQQEFTQHERECAAARSTGRPDKPDATPREEGEDREWVSTP